MNVGQYKKPFRSADTARTPNASVHTYFWSSNEIHHIKQIKIDTSPDAHHPEGGTNHRKRHGGHLLSERAFPPKRRSLFLIEDPSERVSCLPTLGDAMDGLRQAHLGGQLAAANGIDILIPSQR